MKTRREKNFISFFDEISGLYFRTGIIENGKDSGRDPFMTSFPELLDIGIMGHCVHGQKGLCLRAGVECYQDGLHRDDANMSIEDFASIVRQCGGRTYQFALGGCGDPDQHEDFADILKICRKEGIVPNFTTSGMGLTEKIVDLCKEYCGAVAVSWYRSEYTKRAIRMLVEAGVKTNIHYVLSKDTIEEAVERMATHTFPENINAVIFLLHKPVGLGKTENIITMKHELLPALIRMVDSGKSGYKIGFDSCTVPALINGTRNINPASMDTCEGARWSAYISPDMKMMPCSFDNQDMRWAVDIRKYTIEEAWNSREFEAFRTRLKTACPDCELRDSCMGGCPVRPEIVLCDRKERLQNNIHTT